MSKLPQITPQTINDFQEYVAWRTDITNETKITINTIIDVFLNHGDYAQIQIQEDLCRLMNLHIYKAYAEKHWHIEKTTKRTISNLFNSYRNRNRNRKNIDALIQKMAVDLGTTASEIEEYIKKSKQNQKEWLPNTWDILKRLYDFYTNGKDDKSKANSNKLWDIDEKDKKWLWNFMTQIVDTYAENKNAKNKKKIITIQTWFGWSTATEYMSPRLYEQIVRPIKIALWISKALNHKQKGKIVDGIDIVYFTGSPWARYNGISSETLWQNTQLIKGYVEAIKKELPDEISKNIILQFPDDQETYQTVYDSLPQEIEKIAKDIWQEKILSIINKPYFSTIVQYAQKKGDTIWDENIPQWFNTLQIPEQTINGKTIEKKHIARALQYTLYHLICYGQKESPKHNWQNIDFAPCIMDVGPRFESLFTDMARRDNRQPCEQQIQVTYPHRSTWWKNIAPYYVATDDTPRNITWDETDIMIQWDWFLKAHLQNSKVSS